MLWPIAVRKETDMRILGGDIRRRLNTPINGYKVKIVTCKTATHSIQKFAIFGPDGIRIRRFAREHDAWVLCDMLRRAYALGRMEGESKSG